MIARWTADPVTGERVHMECRGQSVVIRRGRPVVTADIGTIRERRPGHDPTLPALENLTDEKPVI